MFVVPKGLLIIRIAPKRDGDVYIIYKWTEKNRRTEKYGGVFIYDTIYA